MQAIVQEYIYLKYYKCYLGFMGNHNSPLIFLSKAALPFQS